jgi:predicted porin/cell division protein FtsB
MAESRGGESMGAIPSRSSRIYKEMLCAGVALSALGLVFGTSGAANAQSASDSQVRQLQSEIDQLQQSINKLKAQQAQSNADAKSAQKKADEAQAQVAAAAASTIPVKAAAKGVCAPWQIKPGKSLTMCTPGGEVTLYGNFDVSFDDTAKDIGTPKLAAAPGMALPGPPVGNFGWMPAISTNLSYIGARGFQTLPNYPGLNFVYQFEVGFDISATPGLKQSNSNISDTVNGALFNRNTYIGFASAEYGALKIGKTDAPYKNSTAAFNPFNGMLGDYAVMVGNTGGDNRVEFGTRLDHSIWYESPNVNGFQFNALFSPGQNRSTTSDNIAAGESDCTGQNDPTSGGDVPLACNDGSFSDAASTNLSYTNGGFYGTVAYEWHHNVNRQSDITAIYGVSNATSTLPPTTTGLPNAYAQMLFNQDIADEDAAKVAALYNFKSTGTTVGALFEHFDRYVPADLEFQNERQRNGTWVFLSQQLTERDSVHFGWGHAFATPGDPGQHNDATLLTVDGAGTYAPNDNQADLLTAAYKRKLSENLTWYTNVAATLNGPSAHYDLGAGGRGVTTDCHDASDATGGAFSNPHCYTGTTIMGASTGIQWRF